MSNPMVRIHDVQTNQIIDREMNDTELVQWELDQQKAHNQLQAEIEAEAKRQSALAKLAALGLEEDDLKALGL